MARVFVRVTVKAIGLPTFRIGAWRDYGFLPRIGEEICLVESIGSSEFSDEVYLVKVSSIKHYDFAILDVVMDEDEGCDGGWIKECVSAGDNANDMWADHANNLCDWHELKPIPSDYYWLPDE